MSRHAPRKCQGTGWPGRMATIAAMTVAFVPVVAIAQPETTADRAFYAAICISIPCGGTFGSLQLFRDKDGRLVRILARGDFRRCSHPPAVYFDAKGTELDSVDDWLRIDTEKVRTAGEFHARMTAGLTRAEEINCLDACKRPASRPDPNDTTCLMP
jgi:hypothetical protein